MVAGSTIGALGMNRKIQVLGAAAGCALALLVAAPLAARDKGTAESGGLSVNLPVPERELLQAVQDVAADGIIQGSQEYNKDEYVGGAEVADSTTAFPKWTGTGQAFYKVRKNALDPRNFKDSGDSGTLAVRYVVQPQDEKNSILTIDAIFVDDFHRRAHASNGSVEGAEYAAIQDHLAAMQLQKRHTVEEEQRHQQELAAKELEHKQEHQQLELSVAQAPGESLERHVRNLRQEAERRVKAAGGKLRSAPYRSASSLKALPPGTEVVIMIATPYWYGVETEDGQHGWLHRSELEVLP
jgi:hypothetical protein